MDSSQHQSPASPTRVRFAIDQHGQQHQDPSSPSPSSCVKINIESSPSPSSAFANRIIMLKDENQETTHPLFANLDDKKRNDRVDDEAVEEEEEAGSPLPRRVTSQNDEQKSPSLVMMTNSKPNNNNSAFLKDRVELNPRLEEAWNLLFWALQDNDTGLITESSIHSHLAMILPVITWDLPNTDYDCLFIRDPVEYQSKQQQQISKIRQLAQDNDATNIISSSVMRKRKQHNNNNKEESKKDDESKKSQKSNKKKEDDERTTKPHQNNNTNNNSASRGRRRRSIQNSKIITIDDAIVKQSFFRRLLRRFLPSLGHKTQIPLSVLDQGGFIDPSSVAYLDCFSGFAASAVCSRLMKVVAKLLASVNCGNNNSVDMENASTSTASLEITEEMWMNMIVIDRDQNNNCNNIDTYFKKSSLRNEILLSLVDSQSNCDAEENNNNNNKNCEKNQLIASSLLEPRPLTLNSLRFFTPAISYSSQNNISQEVEQDQEEAEAVRIVFLVLLQNATYLRFLLERYETPGRQLARVLIARRMNLVLNSASTKNFNLATSTSRAENNFEDDANRFTITTTLLSPDEYKEISNDRETATNLAEKSASPAKNHKKKNVKMAESHDNDNDEENDDEEAIEDEDQSYRRRNNNFQHQQQHPLYKKLADRQKQLKSISSSTMKKLIKKEKKKFNLSFSKENKNMPTSSLSPSVKRSVFLTTQSIHSSISSSLIAQEFAQELCRWTLHLWAGTRGILDTPIMQRIGERYMEAKAKEFQKLAKRFKRFFFELEHQDNECDALRAGRVNDDEFHITKMLSPAMNAGGPANVLASSVASPYLKNCGSPMMGNTVNNNNNRTLIDQQEMLMSSLQFSRRRNKNKNKNGNNNQGNDDEENIYNQTENNEDDEIISGSPRLTNLLSGTSNLNNTTRNKTILSCDSTFNNNNNNNANTIINDPSSSSASFALNESLNQIGQNPHLWLKQIENSMQPPPFSLLHHLLPEDRQEIKNARFWASVRAFVVGFIAALLIAGGDVLASTILFGPDATTSKKLGLGVDFTSGGTSSSSSSNGATSSSSSIADTFLGFFGVAPANGNDNGVSIPTTTTRSTSSSSFTNNGTNFSDNATNNSIANSWSSSSSSESADSVMVFGSSESVIYWIIVLSVTALVTCVEILYLYIDALNTCYDCAVIVGIVLRHKDQLGKDVSWRQILRKQLATHGEDDEDNQDEDNEENERDEKGEQHGNTNTNGMIDKNAETPVNSSPNRNNGGGFFVYGQQNRNTHKNKKENHGENVTDFENSKIFEELVDIFIPDSTTTMNQQEKIHENEDLLGPSPTGSPSRYVFHASTSCSPSRQHIKNPDDDDVHHQQRSQHSPNTNMNMTNGRIARVTRSKLRSAVLASFRAASRVREVLSRKRSKYIDSAISRCALSLGHSSVSLFGIDLNLSKHGATKKLLKSICQIIRTPLSVALVQFFLGRYIYKILLPFVSAPVCAFWNAVIIWNCMSSMEELAVASVAAERLVLEVVQKSREEILTATIPQNTNKNRDINKDEATWDFNEKNNNFNATSYAGSVSHSRARSQSYCHQIFCGNNNNNNNKNNTATTTLNSNQHQNNNNNAFSLNHLLPDAVEPEFAMPHNIVQLWARAVFSIGTVDAVSTPSFHILAAGLLQRLGPLTPMRLHAGAATEVEEEVADKLHLTDRRLFFVSLCGALFGGHQLASSFSTGSLSSANFAKFKENSLTYRQKVASCVVAMQLTLLIVLEKIDEVVSGSFSPTKKKNKQENGDDDENDHDFSSFTNSSSTSSKYKRILCATIACFVAPKTTFAASSASPHLSSSIINHHNHQQGDSFHYSQQKMHSSSPASKILHHNKNNNTKSGFDNINSSESNNNNHLDQQKSSSSSCCWCCWCVDTTCCEEIGEFAADDIHAAYLTKVNTRAKAISDHIAAFLFGNRLEKEILWNQVIDSSAAKHNTMNYKNKNKKNEDTIPASTMNNDNNSNNDFVAKSRSTTAENDEMENQNFTMIDNVAEMMKGQLVHAGDDGEEKVGNKISISIPQSNSSPSPFNNNNNNNNEEKPSAQAWENIQKSSVSASPSPILSGSLLNNNNCNKKPSKNNNLLSLSTSHSPSLRALSANAVPTNKTEKNSRNISKSKSLSKSYRANNNGNNTGKSEIGFTRQNEDEENVTFALDDQDSSSSEEEDSETDSEVDEILANLPFGYDDEDDGDRKESRKMRKNKKINYQGAPFGSSSSPSRNDEKNNKSKSPSGYFDLFNNSREGSFFGNLFGRSNSASRVDEEKSDLLPKKSSKSKSNSQKNDHNEDENQLNENINKSKTTSRLNSRATTAQNVTREPTPMDRKTNNNYIMSEDQKQLLQDSGAKRSSSVEKASQLLLFSENGQNNFQCQQEHEVEQEIREPSNSSSDILGQYRVALLHINSRLLSLQTRYRDQGKLPHGNEVFDVASDLINLMSVWEYPE